jgi:hypothetical protein
VRAGRRRYRVLLADGTTREFPSRGAYLRYLARAIEGDEPSSAAAPTPQAGVRWRTRTKTPPRVLRPDIIDIVDRLAADAEALRIEDLIAEAQALHHRRLLDDDEVLIQILAQAL